MWVRGDYVHGARERRGLWEEVGGDQLPEPRLRDKNIGVRTGEGAGQKGGAVERAVGLEARAVWL